MVLKVSFGPTTELCKGRYLRIADFSAERSIWDQL